jgi:hypothetical protein
MFTVTKNIYNKRTKGPTLMKLFTATGKLKFFLTARDVRCVYHVPLGQRGYVAIVGRTVFAKIIAAVKSIDALMLMLKRVLHKNLNIVSMCAVSPVVHASNISSCQKKASVLLWL